MTINPNSHCTRSKSLEKRSRAPSLALRESAQTDQNLQAFMIQHFKPLTSTSSSSSSVDNSSAESKSYDKIRKGRKIETGYERPKNKPDFSKEPVLGNGRSYTDKVEFESDRSQQVFAKIWSGISPPKQNEDFRTRCQRYFAKLKKEQRDPALKWVQVATSDDPDLGNGIKAIRRIPKGTLIGHYAGVMRSIRKYDNSRYIFSFDQEKINVGNWYLDAGKRGNVLSCVNANEKKPNVHAYEYYSKEGPRIMYFADEDIDIGEELFISYGNSYWDNVGFSPKKV